MASELALGIRLRFHNHALQQLAIRLPFHQQAAVEFGGNQLGGEGEKGFGEVLGGSWWLWERLWGWGVAINPITGLKFRCPL